MHQKTQKSLEMSFVTLSRCSYCAKYDWMILGGLFAENIVKIVNFVQISTIDKYIPQTPKKMTCFALKGKKIFGNVLFDLA